MRIICKNYIIRFRLIQYKDIYSLLLLFRYFFIYVYIYIFLSPRLLSIVIIYFSYYYYYFEHFPFFTGFQNFSYVFRVRSVRVFFKPDCSVDHRHRGNNYGRRTTFFFIFFPQIRFGFYYCSVRIREVRLSKTVLKFGSCVLDRGRWPTYEVCNPYFLLCTVCNILLLRVLGLFVTFVVCCIVLYRVYFGEI